MTTRSARRPAASAPRSRRPSTSAGTVGRREHRVLERDPRGDDVPHDVEQVRHSPGDRAGLVGDPRDPVGHPHRHRAQPVLAVGHPRGRHRVRDQRDRARADAGRTPTGPSPSARCVPSATSSTTSSPRAAAARHAAIGPGSRWCSGRMPLNRCVAVSRPLDRAASRSNPRSTASSTCSADASVCPIDGTAPTSTRAATTSSAPGTSGATVMVTRCPRAASASAADQLRVARRACPRGSARRTGPPTGTAPRGGCRRSRPRPPGPRAGRSAPAGRRGGAVTSDATRLVVPCRRCSSTARCASAASTASGKLAPPPPWQCRSTRPGRIVVAARLGRGPPARQAVGRADPDDRRRRRRPRHRRRARRGG